MCFTKLPVYMCCSFLFFIHGYVALNHEKSREVGKYTIFSLVNSYVTVYKLSYWVVGSLFQMVNALIVDKTASSGIQFYIIACELIITFVQTILLTMLS